MIQHKTTILIMNLEKLTRYLTMTNLDRFIFTEKVKQISNNDKLGKVYIHTHTYTKPIVHVDNIF